jgi:hypothetical protein
MADKWKSERHERNEDRESTDRVRGRADELDDEFDDVTEDQEISDEEEEDMA